MTTTLEEVIKQAEKLEPDRRQMIAQQMQQILDAAAILDTPQWQRLITTIRLFLESAEMQPHWKYLLGDSQRFDAFCRQIQKAIEEHGRDSTYTQGFLRGVGLDDELIAQVLAAPAENLTRELRLALQAIGDERIGRSGQQPTRYLTFEQFFHELGHTDEQIEEAKRQAAANADV